MSKQRIILVDTAPRGQCGSMTRYADQVQLALGGGSVERVRLALPACVGAVFGSRLGVWVQHGWRLAVGRAWLAMKKADVVHILDGSFAYVAEWVDPARCVVTCHDLIPHLQLEGRIPGRPGAAAVLIMNRSLRVLSRVRHVMADSENTRQDAIRLAGVDPSRISVVPMVLSPDWFGLKGVGMPLRGTHTDRVVIGAHNGRLGEPSLPKILHIGNSASYKNRPAVIRIFSQVRKTTEAHLVLVGPRDSVLDRIATECGVAQDIEWHETLSEDQLKALYRSASVFLFPSLYEGFGWPVLEAMACGCPVVCSTAASLPEVAGGAALMAAPGDELALASHCVRLLTNPTERERYRQAGVNRAAGFTVARLGHDLGKAYLQ